MSEITASEQIRLDIIKKVNYAPQRPSWPLTGLVIAS